MSGQRDAGGAPGAQGRSAPERPFGRAVLDRLSAPSSATLLFVLILGLVVGGVMAASIQRQDPVYESGQPLLIDQATALALAPNGDLVSKLALLRTKYVSIIGSDTVRQAAAGKLGVDATQLPGTVRGAAPAQSLIIEITARSGSAPDARRLASAVGEALGEYLVAEQDAGGVPTDRRITLTPLREASPSVKVEPSSDEALSTGLTGGLLAAVIAYVAFALLPFVLPTGARSAG